MTDQSGSTSYQYDPLGRVTQKTQNTTLSGGGGVHSRSVQYGYVDGRLSTITYPSGMVVTYTHDSGGRVIAIDANVPGSQSGTAVLSNVLYDADGAVAGWTWMNGTQAIREHNEDGRIDLLDSAGGASLAYDDAGRLSGIMALSGSSVPSWSYGYDLQDRLTSAVTFGQSQSFTYDRNGNRLTQGGTPSGTYAYEGGSNLASNRLQLVTSGTNRTYSYDAMGNATADGVNTYTYDGAGRMASANSVTYRYNGLGQRVSKTYWPGNDRNYVFDESGRILECAPFCAGDVQEYIWLGDVPIAVVLGTTYFNDDGYILYHVREILNVHTDHLNTPRRLTRRSDPMNAAQWRWDSDAFGVGFANGNATDDPYLVPYTLDLRFPGQLFDEETWRHYNYFRDYDPYTGRYIESDPIGLEGGINTYTYVSGDPVQLVDPFGLEECCSARATYFDCLANCIEKHRFDWSAITTMNLANTAANTVFGRTPRGGIATPAHATSWQHRVGSAIARRTGNVSNSYAGRTLGRLFILPTIFEGFYDIGAEARCAVICRPCENRDNP